MPEGDTIHAAAERLQPIVGERVERVGGSHRAAKEFGRRVAGHTITTIEARGKHLLIHLDHEWTIRSHMQMTGVWHLYGPGEAWRKTPGKARLVIHTAEHTAVCFAAPTVSIKPTNLIEAEIAHLGPDLIAVDPDWADVLERARRSDAVTMADLLLDQRVMAGIGNVIKNETLFMEGVHPGLPAGDIDLAVLERLGARAQKILRSHGSERSTTGSRAHDGNFWVYGRAGRPCRRCGTPIASAIHGELDRLNYWCPRCQPKPGERQSAGSSPSA